MEGGSETGRKTESKDAQNSSGQPFSHHFLVKPFMETGGSTQGKQSQVTDKVQRLSEDEQTEMGSSDSWARPIRIPEAYSSKGRDLSSTIYLSNLMEIVRDTQSVLSPRCLTKSLGPHKPIFTKRKWKRVAPPSGRVQQR